MEYGLTLNDEQRALQDMAAGFATEFANVRKGAEHDGALWQRMVELGWAAVHAPEAFGGLEMGATELCLLMEEMGRQLLRSPFLPSVVLAQTLVMEAGSEAAKAEWLPRLVEGQVATVIAAPALGFADDGVFAVSACAAGADWVLDGTAEQVLDCGASEVAFVVARLDGGGVGVFAVPAGAEGVTRAALDAWDPSRPQSSWQFRSVKVPAVARVDGEGVDVAMAYRRSVALAALAVAAEQVGGAAQCLALTVAYTAERAQFGKPVATFQAVKHRCAEMMVQLETARSAARGVAARFAELDPKALFGQVAVARVLATGAYRYCAQEAIQLHGGVGFTWEYDPQLHFKRAQSASQWFGRVEHWRERLAADLMDRA